MYDKQPKIIGQNNTQEIGSLENSLIISVTNKTNWGSEGKTKYWKMQPETDAFNVVQFQKILAIYYPVFL